MDETTPPTIEVPEGGPVPSQTIETSKVDGGTEVIAPADVGSIEDVLVPSDPLMAPEPTPKAETPPEEPQDVDLTELGPIVDPDGSAVLRAFHEVCMNLSGSSRDATVKDCLDHILADLGTRRAVAILQGRMLQHTNCPNVTTHVMGDVLQGNEMDDFNQRGLTHDGLVSLLHQTTPQVAARLMSK